MDHSGEAGDDVTTDGIRKFTDSFLAAELKPFLLSGKSLPDYPPPPPPYEVPENPEVHLETANLSVDEAAAQVIRYLDEQNILGEP